MALHLPNGPLKTCSGTDMSQYGDVNPVPTNPLANAIATLPLGPVCIGVRNTTEK